MMEYQERPGRRFPHVLGIPYMNNGVGPGFSQEDISPLFDSTTYWHGEIKFTQEIQDWVDDNVGVALIDYHTIHGPGYMEFRFREKSAAMQFKLMWGV